ncbi:MAG: DUF63 family protein [Candidatus Aenigmatarchaeota archaeon]
MLENFFEKHFIEPIKYSEGYNIVNTITYSLIFIFLGYLAFKIIRKLKIDIDFKLCISIIPFILSSIVIRVLRDAETIKGYLFVTPFIWLISFSTILLLLIITKFLENKKGLPYHKIMFILGFSIFSSTSIFISIKTLQPIFYLLPFILIECFFLKLLKTSLENKIVIGLHLFDSTATAVAINWFGYAEQHVLPKLIIEVTNTPFSFIIVKFIVVYFCLKMLDEIEDREFGKFLKLLVAILGMATGGRSFLRLICQV